MATKTLDYGDIIKLADYVSQYRKFSVSIPRHQAFEVAYDAIISAVLDKGETRLPYLVGIGRVAIWRHLSRRSTEFIDIAPHATGRRFARYWMGLRGYHPDHAPGVDEKLALWQALEGLSEQQRGDLVAFAIYPNVELAAERRGCGRARFYERLGEARREFLKLWFEHESSPEVGRVVKRHGGGSRHKPGQGVYFNRKTGKWFGRGHKRVYLGSFPTKEEAQTVVDAYWAEREELGL